jgi:hypothetical protein
VSVRIAGKRGRLPAKTGSDKLAIGWVHSYLAQPLPAPVYPVDVSGGIKDWGMLGNGPDPTCETHPDGVGDCTFAGREHAKRAKAAAGHEIEQWETSDSLVAEYLAYDHGQDIGANIADLLLYWYRAGRILAFAPVDHTDPDAVDSAMTAFHGAYCGVDLTGDADELFQQGKPWTVANGEQPDPSDGHCIVKVGSDGQSLHNVATGTAYDTWVTWGALQKSSLGWTAAALQEAWVIITEEDARAANLDIAALRADIDALHGTGTQAPAPVHPHASFLTQLADEVDGIAAKVRTFLAGL